MEELPIGFINSESGVERDSSCEVAVVVDVIGGFERLRMKIKE